MTEYQIELAKKLGTKYIPHQGKQEALRRRLGGFYKVRKSIAVQEDNERSKK